MTTPPVFLFDTDDNQVRPPRRGRLAVPAMLAILAIGLSSLFGALAVYSDTVSASDDVAALGATLTIEAGDMSAAADWVEEALAAEVEEPVPDAEPAVPFSVPAPTTTTTIPPTTTTVAAPPTTATAPVAATPAAPAGTYGPNDPAGTEVWDRLAHCEATGNWAINTGNGYYGGLQFSLSSWRSVGGTGFPHEHPRLTQIENGRRLQKVQGWGAWPHCSKKLGLR